MTLCFLIYINFLISQAGITDLFDLSKKVTLPANIQLSQVEYVDVDKNGNLLITDLSRENVILYLSDSESFLELDADECHPGFSFHPIRAHFVDDEIWVFNRQSEVFRFYENGDCKGVYPHRVDAPDFFTTVDETFSAGILPQNYNLSQPVLLLYELESGTEAETISLEDMLAPNMAFRYGGGGMFAHQNRIYFAVSSAPVVYSYSIDDGKSETYYPKHISDLNITENADLDSRSRGNPANILREVLGFIENYSTTINFSKLNESSAVLYVQQPGRSSRELLFFDLESNTFMSQTYTIKADSDEHYQAFANSKAYSVTFDDEADSWKISIYEYQ